MKCVLSRLLILIAVFVFFACSVANTFAQEPKGVKQAGYHLVNNIPVAGAGGWDALIAEPDAHRLYVSHGTRVVVIDTAADKVVGEIPNTNGVHGIALAPKLGRGWTSNGRDDSVTVFDLKTLKTLGTVKTGKNPDIIIYDPASKRVFVFNGRSDDATVIDAADNKVAGTVKLGGKPEFAVSNGKGMVYVNLEDKSEVVAIDSKKLTVNTHWPIAPGDEPTGLAIDRKTNRLFIACGNNKMIVMDAASGKVITDLPTGDGADGAEFDPVTKLAFSPNGEGTLTVVHEDSKDKFTVVENVTTEPKARTMALDTKTHKVYLPSAKFGSPPAPTAEHPHPWPAMIDGSFVILVYGR